MRYAGGKKRLAKEISGELKALEQEMGQYNLPYWEPFFGMGSVCARMGPHKHADEKRSSYDESEEDDVRIRYGSDANADVIELWKAVQKGWVPPTDMTEREWNRLKNSKGPSKERGFAGNGLSFGGQFFSGWAERYDPGHNYAKQGSDAMMKAIPYLEDVNFKAGDYNDVCKREPAGLLVYADPPYAKSMEAKPDKLFSDFDHDRFWDTMRDWSKYNIVVVSEEVAPDDFVCVWSKDFTRMPTNQKKHTKRYTDKGEKPPKKQTVEKLFMHEDYPSMRYFDAGDYRLPW